MSVTKKKLEWLGSEVGLRKIFTCGACTAAHKNYFAMHALAHTLVHAPQSFDDCTCLALAQVTQKGFEQRLTARSLNHCNL